MGVNKWLWKIAARKVVKQVVRVALAWLAANGLADAGVTVNEAQLTLFTYASLELLYNYIKTKTGWSFL